MPMIQQAQAKKRQLASKLKTPTASAAEPQAEEAAPVKGGQSPDAYAEESASPEEQESYEEAIEMLYKMMYVDDKTSATILQMIQPQGKVDSIVKASVLVIQQVDQKLDLETAVIPELVMFVPDMLIELAERGKQMTFSEGELKAILGSTQEMVMQVIDVDAGEARRLMDSITPEQKAQAERDYNKFLGEAEGEDVQASNQGAAQTGSAVPASQDAMGANAGQPPAPEADAGAAPTGEQVMA